MKACFLTLALSALVAAAPQGVPDKPIEFYARLFADSSDCATGGKTYAYLGSRGNCVNIAIPGSGSAVVQIGEVTKYFLAGWTEPDCKGKVVLVESNPGVCTDLGGLDVKSWSNDMSPFGEK
ncbi:hypothetical protein HJFPF1_10303 [Paramyrothecium foliicola]|nr:hypothetical protein HJFPF1_10303 [Paramyrothecium foliicola]